MPDEINGTINAVQDLSGEVEGSNSVNGTVTTETGELTGTVTSNESSISGTVTTNVLSVGATLSDNGSPLNTTLTVHYGADGKDGKDGVSPTISVYEQTKTSYILQITDVNGSYLTPNLMPDTEVIVEGKVDEDLAKYPLISPLDLTHDQRAQTFLYIRRDDLTENQNQKIALEDVALTEEVDEKIRLKLQTVAERPDDWRIGDYIFLEQNSGDGE